MSTSMADMSLVRTCNGKVQLDTGQPHEGIQRGLQAVPGRCRAQTCSIQFSVDQGSSYGAQLPAPLLLTCMRAKFRSVLTGYSMVVSGASKTSQISIKSSWQRSDFSILQKANRGGWWAL